MPEIDKKISLIADSILLEKELDDILKLLVERRNEAAHPISVSGLSDGARAVFYAAVIRKVREKYRLPALILVSDEKDGLKLSNALAELSLKPITYPLRDFVFHNITASHEYEHERLKALSALAADESAYDVIIATPDAAMQYTMPLEVLRRGTLVIDRDDQCELSELVARLEASGYVRSDMVDGVGQYSVRGGIIDIFPPYSEYPVRIELFDTEIDQMGYFDIMTQRKIENISNFTITLAREIVTTPENRADIKKAVQAQLKKASDDRVRGELAAEIEAVDAGLELEFIDKYISLVYENKTTLADYVIDAAGRCELVHPLIFIQDTNATSDRMKAYDFHITSEIESLLEKGEVSARYSDYSRHIDYYETFVDKSGALLCDAFAAGGQKLAGMFAFRTKQTVSYADNMDLLCEDLTAYAAGKFRTVVLCENDITAKNVVTELNERGLQALKQSDENPYGILSLPEGVTLVISGFNLAGFELTATRFALLSMYQNPNSYSRTILSHSKKAKNNRSSQEKILSYNDLSIGDFVVHANHGIGQYLGIEQLTVVGVTKDYIKIKYAGSDMLYLPTDQLDMVSKYIGAHSDSGAVKLSKMGGAEWNKAKTRAKLAAKSMAKELIRLYAERQRREGYAFAEDDEFQREFEAAFEYDETDGQLNSISEIKHDMESKVPMDRLLCGDVGFGKTEVAMRAAFKAVMSGKQVALLVPTTILAMQHYQTILSRMRGFPVKCDMLSRFRTPKQQAETLRRLRRGEVDIIVGTHRLVSSDVVFKDLGLVIVDEEQRFGVAQKEKLKQIAGNVDVLTLTATPIPRTLNMAMSGIRDMSVLDEAPGDRFPVQTFVMEYDELIITEAIKKELRRGGQVFFLHNTVDDIDAVAMRLSKSVPDARIATAHGQMDKEQLSDIWRGMVMGEIDILISTTIIESGVDVPNANTLIIDHADRLGLSQLHQIRGRVGRSSRRAYAYFTYPPRLTLTEIATKRLSAMREYTEFGSGFKIALRDLEIRGAGNLLGAEQHGQLDSIGYDLYVKILNEAVLEEKGEKPKEKFESKVDLSLDAYLPEKYIKSESQRMDIYKKIAHIENMEDLDDLADELQDRFGEIPRQADTLMYVSLARSLCSQARIPKIEHKGQLISIIPEQFDPVRWAEAAAMSNVQLTFQMAGRQCVNYKIKNSRPLYDICDVLKNYLDCKKK
ncbi:MAG: transcription-repair coupling factor [Clostridiales bacterium]|nr:transcription-repair coupling factor [Clostridiales bacterium]